MRKSISDLGYIHKIPWGSAFDFWRYHPVADVFMFFLKALGVFRFWIMAVQWKTGIVLFAFWVIFSKSEEEVNPFHCGEIQVDEVRIYLAASTSPFLNSWFHCRNVKYVWMGTPCHSWSRARRWDGRGPGPLRDDHQFLMGYPDSYCFQPTIGLSREPAIYLYIYRYIYKYIYSI